MNLAKRSILLTFSAGLACGQATDVRLVEELDRQSQALTPPSSCDPANPITCCHAGATVVQLTQGNDVTANFTANRCILALGGHDNVFSASSGNVTIMGGPGDDTMSISTDAGVVFGNAGNDTIFAGKSFIVPGPGADVVNSYGIGNTVAIHDLCEVASGEQLASDGTGTLITPVPVSTLQSLGVTVSGFSQIVVQQNSCKSECVTKPTCPPNSHCAEGASPGQVKCECNPGFPNCDNVIRTGSSLWELSTAVAPQGTPGCPTDARYFVSIGVHGGGSTPGTGDNALLLQGNVGCTTVPGTGCVTDVFNSVLFPLRPNPQPLDQTFADNVMTRMPDGTILLLRDLGLDKLPFPKLDDGAGLWASSDCGNTWQFRSFLDPADTASFPPPELTDGTDPAATYAADRVDGLIPGWDREEIYADQFRNGDVYASFRPGAGIDATGTGDKYFDTTFARSHDGGATWNSYALVPAAIVPPVMMNSNPGRVFMFDCEGPPGVPDLPRAEAVLRWSDDRGATTAGRFIVSGSFASNDFVCASQTWGVEGSQNITRVRYSETKSGATTTARRDVVRVIYPAISGGRQVAQVFEVTLQLGSPPSAQLVATISDPTADVVQVAAAEPDPSQVPNALITTNLGGGLIRTDLATSLGTALITWKAIPPAGPVVLRGAFVNATTGQLGTAFNISTPWAGITKTGDYSRVAFFNDQGTFKWFVPWIEEDAAGLRRLRIATAQP